MTQTEVPQVSLARYLDLLKRRRWQVVPASILGLLVGGIVAFFIPRYFVASTQIHYRPVAEQRGDEEDPFSGLVNDAKLTIPIAIEKTIRDLGWPESLAEDLYELSENIHAIEGRLEVFSQGDARERSFVLIRVNYKDRDGLRAEEFLNKLVETWIEEERRKLAERARAELGKARDEVTAHSVAYRTYVEKRSHLGMTYQIVPDLLPAQRWEAFQERQRMHAEASQALADLRESVASLKKKLEVQKDKLTKLPARIPVDPIQQMREAAKNKDADLVIATIALRTREREFFNESNAAWRTLNHQIELLQAKLVEYIPEEFKGDAEGMMANPEHEAIATAIEKLELDLAGAAGKLEEREASFLTNDVELERQVIGHKLYDTNEVLLEQKKASLEAASEKMRAARTEISKLESDPTVTQPRKAQVPAAPTDPNLFLVALIGCIIGLFAAIALILLLDVLQATFKTVSDVEHGLDVPMLGSMSHMETDAQQLQSARTRRRAMMLVLAATVFLGSVVVLYYYDPARLPPFVRDLLAAVLGTA